MQKVLAGSGAVEQRRCKPEPAQGTRSDRKGANAIHGRSAHAITHLIPEVRPLPGQRFALFKNAPGVFFRAVGRFPPLTVFAAR